MNSSFVTVNALTPVGTVSAGGGEGGGAVRDGVEKCYSEKLRPTDLHMSIKLGAVVYNMFSAEALSFKYNPNSHTRFDFFSRR
jgi:hypothetical protein